MKKITFSAVTIARNEEARIENFLRSLKWCDEIIVVDDQSSDKTREIARRYGARVISDYRGSQTELYRYALTQAKKDWIIWGGADQWVDEELVADIKKRVGKEEFAGYIFNMQEYFLGKPIKIKDDPEYLAVWVVKREKMIIPDVKVHIYIKADGPVGLLRGAMHHDTYRSFSQIIAKFNYYTSMQAEEHFENGVRTSLLRVFLAPLYLILWRQIKLKEYRDGAIGLLVSVMLGLDKFFYHLKIWELQYKKGKKTHDGTW